MNDRWAVHHIPRARVRTGPGKPRKSWNFIMAFSRTGTGKRPLVLESYGNLLNSAKRYEVYGRQ